MLPITVVPLRADLPFGSRISGVTEDVLRNERVRAELTRVFEDRGLIVFEGIEPSSRMQLALSDLFGPLQDHALRTMTRVDQELMPGVVEIDYEGNVYEIDGEKLSGWVPWHFDACYTKELNRGGVLRTMEIPPEGGRTGFADGVQLYDAISSELRASFEDLNILYHPKLMFMHQRFGRPKHYRVISLSQSALDVLEEADGAPRSIHPAVWKRRSGEHVLHVSPWQAAAVQGREDPAGDALLEALCQEMYAKMKPYWHDWKPTDMIAWDNWRFLHSVSGNDPSHVRRVHRTTIQGDYGLGSFENEAGA